MFGNKKHEKGYINAIIKQKEADLDAVYLKAGNII